ncbi:hypothetical protein ZWY2020_055747 [Hordeum vulgare]|nr:hypothetical protein ZWY2020_055747 [Hordeum vulgare]
MEPSRGAVAAAWSSAPRQELHLHLEARPARIRASCRRERLLVDAGVGPVCRPKPGRRKWNVSICVANPDLPPSPRGLAATVSGLAAVGLVCSHRRIRRATATSCSSRLVPDGPARLLNHR